MKAKPSTNRTLTRMFANVLSIVVMLALAFPATGAASAQDEPPPPPNPFIAVSLTEHWFWVNNFAPETLVTFSIYDNQGDSTPILEFSKPTDAMGNLTIDGWAHIWDPEPGDYIVATDGTNTKDLVLEYITLDVFDFENDLVSGYALPGREVGVGVGNETGEQWMNVFADDQTGEWIADFKLEGFVFDITENSWAGGHMNDEDGDVTAAHNTDQPEPPTWFTVFPEQDAVEAWDFPLGAVVHLEIEDPTTEVSPDHQQDEPVVFAPWGSWQLWVWFDLAGAYDVKAGDIVTLRYQDTVRTHIVQNLAVTRANHADNTIKGIADPGAQVYVWPHATGEQQMAIAKTRGAAKGKWTVDFSGIYDLAPGECGRSEIRDEFGNSTALDWCIPNPRIVASESGDWFWTTEFKPGDLDISIYDSPDVGANLLWSGRQVADESGFVLVGSDIHGQDLVPGNYLVVSDGDSQKSLVLQPISVTMFDTEYDFMAGFAPAGSEVWAAAGPQDWQERLMVEADQNTGAWFVDFAEIGFDITEDMRTWSYAQIYDEDGDANEGSTPPLVPNLIVIANQPDWVDSGITVSAGQSFTIEVFGLMNPCSDTYPNGSEICIFYTPVGGEWAVPEENDFGVFPGPELPFMALLGRIGDGQPFLVGEGGTFTAEESGTLWFTPNDNLRTDNQGAYGVLVWPGP